MLKKDHLKLFLRITLSVILLSYLLYKADLGSLWPLVKSADVLDLVLALALLFVTIVLSAWRWVLVTEGPLGFGRALSYVFIGNFFSCFLPTSFGGDGVRILYLRGILSNTKMAVMSVFWDRYLGLCGLVGVGAVSYLLSFDTIAATPVAWLYPMILAGMVGLSLLIFHLAKNKGRSFLFIKQVEHVPELPVMVKALAISVAIQAIGITAAVAIVKALGLSITAMECFLYMPIGLIVGMLPLSISGIGIRESAMVYLLGLSGVPAHEALALSLGWFFAVTATSVVGAFEQARIGR